MTTPKGLSREQLVTFLGEMLTRETRDPIENRRPRLQLNDQEWADLDAEAQRVVDASLVLAQAGADAEPSAALKYACASIPATTAPMRAERQR